MDRHRALRLFVILAGALATGVAILVVFAFINGGTAAGAAATSRLGWTMPLLAGGLIGAVAWTLMFQVHCGDDEEPCSVSVPCPTCGKAVLREWRLCPYCGRALQGVASAGQRALL